MRRFDATEYMASMYSKGILLKDYGNPSDRRCVYDGVPRKML